MKKNNICVLFPDSGAYKWGIKLLDKLGLDVEVYTASKSRKFENGKSILTQMIDKQDFDGKDVLIIDDCLVFGGTFIGLAKLLKERNVGNLYLAVSHITVKNPNKELEGAFKKIYATNSKYDEYDLSNLTLFNFPTS